jgi:acetyl-CoA carboxylase carboxyl transferase subunit beta
MAENLPRIGSALLVRDEVNRILLGKRNKDPQRGNWIIPGGKIHAFESIAEAAARELLEETGLIVEVGDHFNVYEIINPPNEHRIVIYSWGKVIGGEPKASDDISELKFFELAELGEVPVTPLVRRVLIDAGFMLDHARPQRAPAEQRILVPILVAGASEHEFPARRPQPTKHVRQGRRRSVCKSGLLFDMSPQK